MKTSNRLEDYSAEEIAEEIERGARIVSYVYCISLLVLTFKRSTRPYFIKAGQGRVGKGLPWAVLTMLLGWWGFPWGLIYTPMALWQTLRGGVDLTGPWIDDYAARMAPAPTDAGAASAQPSQKPAGRKKSRFLTIVGTMVALAICGSVVFSIFGKKGSLVLVNGLAEKYTVTINGEPHFLQPFEQKKLDSLPNGTHTIHAVLPAPGSPVFQTTLTLEKENTFGDGPLVVINPDQLALVFEERLRYGVQDESAHTSKLHVNSAVLKLANPDYLLSQFPKTIRTKTGASRVRTRVGALGAGATFAQRMAIVNANNGDAAAKAYFVRASALMPDDNTVLAYVPVLLDAEAVRKFFEQHLGTFPVLVNLHRAYQDYSRHYVPTRDLGAEYHVRLAKHPDDGALLYLTGRALSGMDESRPYLQHALQATPPCHYAWLALAYDDQNAGRFEHALEAATQGLAAVRAKNAPGERLLADSLAATRRDMLAATGQLDAALAEAKRAHEGDLNDFQLAKTFFLFQGLCKRPEAEVTAAITKFGKVAKANGYDDDDIKDATAALKACDAYGRGNMAAYRSFSKQRDSEMAGVLAKIEFTLSEGDIKAAHTLIENQPDMVYSHHWFLLQILASRSGDDALASEFFGKAVAGMATETAPYRLLAVELAAGRTPDAAALLRSNITPLEKSAIACALGWRDAAHRTEYFALAKKMNFSPEFPYQLIKQATEESKQAAAQ